MKFLWFKPTKGKREAGKSADIERKDTKTFNSELLEAAYYHSDNFLRMRTVNSKAARSCAYSEGTLAIRCYLQHLCVRLDGKIRGTRAIPPLARYVSCKSNYLSIASSSRLLKLSETIDTVYSELGICEVTLEGLDELKEIMTELDSICCNI